MASRTSIACVLLAEGFEEIEAVTVADVLRRAEVDTRLVGVAGRRVCGAHGIVLEADTVLADAPGPFDAVVLPGGMPGAAHLRDDPAVRQLVRAQVERGALAAAICAAPMALAAAGVLDGRRATCYPGFEDRLAGATVADAPVVEDGPVVTSRGPGTALAFALALVARLRGSEVRDALARGMLAGG